MAPEQAHINSPAGLLDCQPTANLRQDQTMSSCSHNCATDAASGSKNCPNEVNLANLPPSARCGLKVKILRQRRRGLVYRPDERYLRSLDDTVTPSTAAPASSQAARNPLGVAYQQGVSAQILRDMDECLNKTEATTSERSQPIQWHSAASSAVQQPQAVAYVPFFPSSSVWHNLNAYQAAEAADGDSCLFDGSPAVSNSSNRHAVSVLNYHSSASVGECRTQVMEHPLSMDNTFGLYYNSSDNSNSSSSNSSNASVLPAITAADLAQYAAPENPADASPADLASAAADLEGNWVIGTGSSPSVSTTAVEETTAVDDATDPLIAAAHSALAAATAAAAPGTHTYAADTHTLVAECNSGAVLLLGHGSTVLMTSCAGTPTAAGGEDCGTQQRYTVVSMSREQLLQLQEVSGVQIYSCTLESSARIAPQPPYLPQQQRCVRQQRRQRRAAYCQDTLAIRSSTRCSSSSTVRATTRGTHSSGMGIATGSSTMTAGDDADVSVLVLGPRIIQPTAVAPTAAAPGVEEQKQQQCPSAAPRPCMQLLSCSTLLSPTCSAQSVGAGSALNVTAAQNSMSESIGNTSCIRIGSLSLPARLQLLDGSVVGLRRMSRLASGVQQQQEQERLIYLLD